MSLLRMPMQVPRVLRCSTTLGIRSTPLAAQLSSSSLSASAAPVSSTASKAKSMVKSIFLGNADQEQLDGSEEQYLMAHSKLAARGKYVHELQTHNVRPHAWDDYCQLIAEHYPRIAENPEFKVKLFGSFNTEIGQLDQAVHIWEYNNYPGYDETMTALARDPVYQKFLKELRPMLRSRENQIMLEFDFWNSSPPATNDGIYELRTYTLKPGRLMEWKSEWKKGILARQKYVKPVGAWFSQLGDLHVVHHMWVYPNLQARKEMREACWQVDGWAQTVYNTVRMIDRMHCRIVRPYPFSPLK